MQRNYNFAIIFLWFSYGFPMISYDFYFQLKESLPPHHIRIPTPASAHSLGDTSGGLHEKTKLDRRSPAFGYLLINYWLKMVN